MPLNKRVWLHIAKVKGYMRTIAIIEIATNLGWFH